MDGRRTVSEICRLSGNPDELSTLVVLHNLVRAKFVQVVPPLHPPSAEPEPEPAAPAEPSSTVKFQDGAPAPPMGPVSVDFSLPVPARRPEDDTKEVVTPRAVPYMGDSQRITVSRLVLLSEDAEKSFPLTRDSHSVGRHKNNDIVVNDAKVSSFHARIDRTPDGFVVVDLKSRNGSFVNGRRADNTLLKTGDEIRMGTARMQYRVDYQT